MKCWLLCSMKMGSLKHYWLYWRQVEMSLTCCSDFTKRWSIVSNISEIKREVAASWSSTGEEATAILHQPSRWLIKEVRRILWVEGKKFIEWVSWYAIVDVGHSPFETSQVQLNWLLNYKNASHNWTAQSSSEAERKNFDFWSDIKHFQTSEHGIVQIFASLIGFSDNHLVLGVQNFIHGQKFLWEKRIKTSSLNFH